MRILSFDPGYRNLGVCLVDFDDDTLATDTAPSVMYWQCDTLAVDNVRPTAAQLVSAVVQYVHEREWTYTMPDVVVIEQQVDANHKMRAVANALHGVILALARTCGNADLKVVYVAAHSKVARFKYFCKLPAATYRERKQNGVRIAEGLCRTWGIAVPAHLNFDMADAFGDACVVHFAHSPVIAVLMGNAD